jgi:hypothetical protein
VATFSNGRLYRYTPSDGRVRDLGMPRRGATHLFGLAVASNGTVFVGEYPTGKVYSWRGGRWLHDYGQVSPDSFYTRSIQLWRGMMLVGLGTQRARLFAIDIRTGFKREIPLPAPYNAENEITQVTVRADFAYVRTAKTGTLLVYDLKKRTWSTDAGQSNGQDVSPVAPGSKIAEIYHVRGGMLTAFSPVTGQSRGIPRFTGMFSSRGFTWARMPGADLPGLSLVMADYLGRLWVYNPTTNATRLSLAKIPGAPTAIRSLGLGPGGKIWAGGFGSGGLASYDPATAVLRQVPAGTVGQSDEMLTVDGELWLGTYPGANLLQYDPAKPFEWLRNPRSATVLAADGQDRPMALTTVSGRIVIGSVPAYGQLGGAITVHDPMRGTTYVERHVAGPRSVVALTSDGLWVYGATSKWGGLGIAPAAGAGTIFAYDAVTRTKLWEVTPYPGQPAITELAAAPDGTLWGLTNGKLFQFDPHTLKIVREVPVPGQDWSAVDHVWSEMQSLAVAADGTVYAQVRGQLLRVRPGAARAERVGNAATFVLANESTIYLARGANLYRLDLR